MTRRKRKKKPVVEVEETPPPTEEEEAAPEPEEPEEPEPRVIYKMDPRYEVLKGALFKSLRQRPSVLAVQKNPILYNEWALTLERLLM